MASAVLSATNLGQSLIGANPVESQKTVVSASVTNSGNTPQASSIQSVINSTPGRHLSTAMTGPNNYGPVGQQMNYGPPGTGALNPGQGQFGYGHPNYSHSAYGPIAAGPINHGLMSTGPAQCAPTGHGAMPLGAMGQVPMGQVPMVQGPTPPMAYGSGSMGSGPMGPVTSRSMGPGLMGPAQGPMGPRPLGPGLMGPGPMGPGPMGPGPMGPGPMRPGHMVPSNLGQGPMGPGPMMPGTMGHGTVLGPTSMGSGPMGPTSMGAGQIGPGPMGPGPMVPGPRGPGPMVSGPRGPGPMVPGPRGPGPMVPGPRGLGPMGPGPMRPSGPGPLGPSVVGPTPTRHPTHSNNITVPIRSSGPNPNPTMNPAPARMPGHYASHPVNSTNKSNKRAHDDGEATKSGFEADLNLKGQHIPQQKSVKTFSIATRGIGLVTAIAYSRLYESNKADLKNIPVLSIYRAALAFFELKICQAQKKRPKTKSDFSCALENLWKDVSLLPEMERLVKIYSRTLPPIAAVINAIGNFSKDNSWYNVGLINDHLNIAHPLTVTLSNLNHTVTRLSQRLTPKKERSHFHDHNPIPGSVWTDESHADHPLLLNPDEIMPVDYLEERNLSKLQLDLMNSVRAAELASSNNSGMWEDTLVHLEGNGMGNIAVCASCTLKPLRIPNAPEDHEKGSVGYPQVTDRMMSMYTDMELSPSERCLGILSLAGELDILQINDDIPQWAETRSPRGARFVMDCDWIFCASVSGIYS